MKKLVQPGPVVRVSGVTTMPETHHATVSRLFLELVELPDPGRMARLDALCAGDPALRAELLRLLESDEATAAFLATPALGPEFSVGDAAPPVGAEGSAAQDPAGAGALPRRFAGFLLRRVIAAGGTSIVYEAEQDQPHRVVALKVLRAGLLASSSLRRFRIETEVLGRLQHPGIARIYGAGVHRESSGDPGTPYFAMELIHGRAITDEARARGLDGRARLELVARVCDAVQHAHQHGVVHRDLKPANILVDEHGHPKVLDFGVARATDVDVKATLQTEIGQLVGTIPYMSPEQVAGRPESVDTRSDVYALGVLLYELLADRLPYPVRDRSLPEAARLIRESIPPGLSTIDRRLRGDVTTIVAKALEKNPADRYTSAAELGADIRRFLASEPILARPPTAWYVLRRTARRHRVVFGAAGAVVLTLVAAAIVSAVLAIEATRARDHSEQSLRDSLGVSSFLLDLFLEAPDEPTVSRTELLEKAELMLNTEGVGDPRLEAKVREFVGHGWLKLFYHPRAEPHLTRALEIRRSLGTVDDDLVKSLHLLAMLRFAQGRVDDGRVLLREALTRRRQLHGPRHLATNLDNELLFYVERYTPDDPDVALLRAERHALRDRPAAPAIEVPGAMRGAPALLEDFDTPSLDPRWEPAHENLRAWTWRLEESRLTITALDPTAPPGPNPSSAVARLRRTLENPLGDFHVAARLGWDSHDAPSAVQTADLWLIGPGGRGMVLVSYSDSWLQWEGARNAGVGYSGEVGRDVVRVNSGYDTLPPAGEADIVIARTGDRVNVWWDGHLLHTGISTDPLVGLFIRFTHTPYDVSWGKATFGEVWIDRIEVRGLPAAEPLTQDPPDGRPAGSPGLSGK